MTGTAGLMWGLPIREHKNAPGTVAGRAFVFALDIKCPIIIGKYLNDQ